MLFVVQNDLFSFFCGSIVLSECSKKYQEEMYKSISEGHIAHLDIDAIKSTNYIDLLENYSLGPGETEAICLAQHYDMSVCCDDKAARKVAEEQLGVDRVTGSIGVLHQLCKGKILNPATAFSWYRSMKSAGGFLPDLPDNYFES